jgi:hypothetical protein
MSERKILFGSDFCVNVLLPKHSQDLSVELGKIKWGKGHEFWVEFLRLPLEARQRLNSMLRTELIKFLKTHSGKREFPKLLSRNS